jgi:hypothetical protein
MTLFLAAHVKTVKVVSHPSCSLPEVAKVLVCEPSDLNGQTVAKLLEGRGFGLGNVY